VYDVGPLKLLPDSVEVLRNNPENLYLFPEGVAAGRLYRSEANALRSVRQGTGRGRFRM
jgi:hypothetical protein